MLPIRSYEHATKPANSGIPFNESFFATQDFLKRDPNISVNKSGMGRNGLKHINELTARSSIPASAVTGVQTPGSPRKFRKAGPPQLQGEASALDNFFVFATNLFNRQTFYDEQVGKNLSIEDRGTAIRYRFKEDDFDEHLELKPRALQKKRRRGDAFAITSKPLAREEDGRWHFQVEITDAEGMFGSEKDGLAIGFSTKPPTYSWKSVREAAKLSGAVTVGYDGSLWDGKEWKTTTWNPATLANGDTVGILVQKPSGKREAQPLLTVYVNESVIFQNRIQCRIPKSEELYGLVEMVGNTHAVEISNYEMPNIPLYHYHEFIEFIEPRRRYSFLLPKASSPSDANG